MGKRSKRREKRSKDDDESPPTPSSLVSEEAGSGSHRSNRKKTAASSLSNLDEETSDNLHFEDPFVDQYEDEDEESHEQPQPHPSMDCDVDIDVNPSTGTGTSTSTMKTNSTTSRNTTSTPNSSTLTDPETIQSWNPLTSAPLDPNTRLEIDESAYKMHHSLTPDWPALSFDVLHDTLGDARTRFPHSMVVAVGSQADRADRNRLTIMKLSDLVRTGKRNKTEQEIEDEMLGEEYGKDDDDDDEEEEDEADEEDDLVDLDPVLEHYNLKHKGAINRVRAMPQSPQIIATWSDVGAVNLYNVKGILDNFQRSSNTSNTSNPKNATANPTKIERDPFFVYQSHSTEGYAMDWSPVSKGHLATGDCHGNIHLWRPTERPSSLAHNPYDSSSFAVRAAYGPSSEDNLDNPSVEDIQWSPSEGTVLAAAECGGYVKIYDTRCEGRAMLSRKIHENSADVNVIGWNPIVSNLLASGGDDGAFSVWDLRNFQSTDPATAPKPLARFTCHRQPITSLEWHPTDESMIVVTDEDGTYIYDLSIEEDDAPADSDNDNGNGGKEKDDAGDIPPQLLFVHCGSKSTKEAHWHPQITSCVVTTALSGYSVFIPSNL